MLGYVARNFRSQNSAQSCVLFSFGHSSLPLVSVSSMAAAGAAIAAPRIAPSAISLIPRFNLFPYFGPIYFATNALIASSAALRFSGLERLWSSLFILM